jgi:hypothetical protein
MFSAISSNEISYVGSLDHGSIDDEKIQTKRGGPFAVGIGVPHGWAGAIVGCGVCGGM